MYRGLLAMLAGVLAIVAVGAGCGSDEESLTTAVFLKQANAICKQSDEEVGKKSIVLIRARADLKKDQSLKEGLAELGEEILIPAYRELVEELRELPPPSGDEEKVEAILSGIEKDLEEGEAKPELLPELTTNAASDALQLADEYGLEEC